MNNTFLRREVVFLLALALFSLLVFGIHWYIIYHFFEDKQLTLPLWTIYAFHFITVFIVYSVVNFKASAKNGEVFSLFMGATLLKMILAIVFMLPVLLNEVPDAQTDVFNFFIPYFLFLAFEVGNITIFLRGK